MPYLSEKITIRGTSLDRRRKLSEQEKKDITAEYKAGKTSYNKLARQYGVSKRLIIFTVNPEKRLENYKKRVERGGSQQYYEKDSHNLSVKRLRQYKQKLYLEGKL